MARFSSAVFDMDGLLLDSEAPIRDAWLATCAAHGIDIDARRYGHVVGLNATDSRAHLAALLAGRLDFADAAALVAAALQQRHPGGRFALMPGARALLERLRKMNVPCAIASSSSRHEISLRLGAAGVANGFAAIAAGDEVARGKPAPDLYLLACERLGRMPPGRCLAFEDSHAGATSALAAGMHAVVVPGLNPPSHEVLDRCLGVLGTLEEAVSMCDEWFGDGGAPP